MMKSFLEEDIDPPHDVDVRESVLYLLKEDRTLRIIMRNIMIIFT